MSGFELVCAMRCGSRVGSYYQYYHSYRTAWDRGQEGAGAASLSARGAEGIHLNDSSFPTVGKIMLDVDANGDGEIRLRNSNSTLTSVISGGEDSYLLGGKVGIGTTSPASKLEVAGGDIEVDDSGSGLILKSANGSRWRQTISNTGVPVYTQV